LLRPFTSLPLALHNLNTKEGGRVIAFAERTEALFDRHVRIREFARELMCFEMCLLSKGFTIGSSLERQLVTRKGDGFISLGTLADQIECGSLKLTLC